MNYNIKENIEIKDVSKLGNDLTNIIKYHFAMLDSITSSDECAYADAVLTADGKEIARFNKDDSFTGDFGIILNEIGQRQSFEFSLFIDFSSYITVYPDETMESNSDGCFIIADYLSEQQPDGYADNLFYSMFLLDESEEVELFAYGKKNGKNYCGKVKEIAVDNIHDCSGNWFPVNASVWYDIDDIAGKDIDGIKHIFSEIAELDALVDVSTDGTEFAANNFEPNNTHALEMFLKLCGELAELTDDNSIDLSFADFSDKYGRLLSIKICGAEKYEIYSSEI